MRVKLTWGMTLPSTKVMIFPTSPPWIALSDLMLSSTSVEVRLINASGASSEARTNGAANNRDSANGAPTK